jgi:transcriptional regulatory protein LEU3
MFLAAISGTLLRRYSDCHRFYQDFHPQVPILDPLVLPEDLYGYSTLLFWVVLSIGSRKYDKHPTLVHALAPRVTSHVMMSMNSRNLTLEVVQTLILLLTWPFPSTSFYRTSSFVHGGVLIHMAMQCGLHTPYIQLEPSTLGFGSLETASIERAKLWVYAVITYQRCVSSLIFS